jgi:hypothetical protein
MIASDSGPYQRTVQAQASTALSDWMRFWNDGVLQPVLQGLSAAAGNLSTVSFQNLSRGTPATARSRPGVLEERCGCGEHRSCACDCCVGDADFVLYARSGERRIVPLVIENPHRRERRVTLAQGPWTTAGGGSAPVRSQLVPSATELVLAPCESREVVLVIDFIDASKPAPNGSPELRDVDRCEVYYSDLRIDGCGVRPVRMAIAVLPRDCGPFSIECRCGCC